MSNHERENPLSPDGDAALNRAWQQASDEQPPPPLDAAIIAAARKSIQGRDEQAQAIRTSPRSRSWLTRWQPLAAAAAVAGLAFVLVQSLPRDRDVAPSVQMEEPVTTPAAAQERPSNPSTREASEAKAASPPASVGAHEPVAAPDSDIDQKSAADSTTARRATEFDQRQIATPQTAGRAASAAAAAPAPAPARDNVAPPDAADRAAVITALYDSGDIIGAADALRTFRAADPDADTYLPESLRNWARTVQ
jgi:negative regulator of sigma E activity